MKQGWEIKKLGEVCKLYQPKTISGEMLEEEGRYLVYGANGVIGRYNDYNHEESEVLLTCRGATCGSINMSEPYSWINGNAMVVKPVDKYFISQSFLRYYLESVDWSEVITGAAQPQITRQSLSPLSIPVPPIAEQEKIVAELDCLSGIIEKKKQQLKELDNLAQSIFYEMFGNPVGNERGWIIKSLRDVTTKIGSGATPKGGNQSYKDVGISLIRSMNVHNNMFVYKDLAHIDDVQATILNNVAVQEKDILLNITGASVARCCITPNDVLPARVNQHVSIIRPIVDVDNIFLCYQLTTETYQQELLSIGKSNGATREALTKSQLESLSIIVPPLVLQQDFASKIESIEKQKDLIAQSIKETETLFNSRMDYYFN